MGGGGGGLVTVVTGLDHLNGREVWALADGNVCGPYTVADGQIDISAALPDGASLVHVGLRYDAEVESLDLPPGEGKTRIKALKEAAVELEASRGLWIGEDLDHLTEWRQRKVSDSYGAPKLFSGTVKVNVSTRWGLTGRLALRQVDPLPCTVLAFSREVVYGD